MCLSFQLNKKDNERITLENKQDNEDDHEHQQIEFQKVLKDDPVPKIQKKKNEYQIDYDEKRKHQDPK